MHVIYINERLLSLIDCLTHWFGTHVPQYTNARVMPVNLRCVIIHWGWDDIYYNDNNENNTLIKNKTNNNTH